jgi:hypothetical protein
MVFGGAAHSPSPLARGWIVFFGEIGSRSFAALHSGLYSFAPPALVSCNFSHHLSRGSLAEVHFGVLICFRLSLSECCVESVCSFIVAFALQPAPFKRSPAT